jgi:murein DD-endopeptidase MepM/ murein hydrolase activator NlpD
MENSYFNMRMTSPFGERIDPISGKQATHFGIDFVNDEQQVLAGLSGCVRLSRFGDHGEGYFVQIKARIRGVNFYCNHFHNSKKFAHEGESVTMNDLVAVMGSTGRSTGPHIHLEICTYAKTAGIVKRLKKRIPFIETPDRIFFDPLRLYEYFEIKHEKY